MGAVSNLNATRADRYDLPAAAAYLGVSARTVRRYQAEGRLPKNSPRGCRNWWTEAELASCQKSLRQAFAPPNTFEQELADERRRAAVKACLRPLVEEICRELNRKDQTI